jgi:hypothetical protein
MVSSSAAAVSGDTLESHDEPRGVMQVGAGESVEAIHRVRGVRPSLKSAPKVRRS